MRLSSASLRFFEDLSISFLENLKFKIFILITLKSQSIIATLQSGEKKSLDELYTYAIVIMSGKLFELGFFNAFDKLGGLEKQKAVFDMTRKLMPHQIGHFIGLGKRLDL